MRLLCIVCCIAALAVLFILLGTPAVAQPDPISTDRPGFGTGTSLVAPGALQIEAGTPSVALDRSGGREFRLISFPTLLRLGLSPRIEARAQTAVYSFRHTDAGSQSVDVEGFGNGLEVGLKLALLEGAESSVALIPSVVLPVGDDDFTGDRAAFTTSLAADFSLTQQAGLNVTGGLSLNPAGGDDYAVAGSVAGALGRSFTDRAGGYVEAAYLPSEGVPDPLYLGAGLTYLLSSTAQVDVFFDREAGSTSATDWLFGGGLSVRFGR